MHKVKKLSALLLAVVMMMVVLTGCSMTGDPNERFVEKLNIARRSNGYSTVEEDGQLDDLADALLDYYVSYYQGKISASQLAAAENQVKGLTGRCDHGVVVTVTAVSHIEASANLFYNDPTYYVEGPITQTRGRYVGVASRRVGSKAIIAIVMAY